MISTINRCSTAIVAPRDTFGGGRGPARPSSFAYDRLSLLRCGSTNNLNQRSAAAVTAVDAGRMGFTAVGAFATKRRCSIAPVRAAATPSAGDERRTWIPLPRATLDLPPGEFTEVASAGVTYPLGFRAAAVHAGLRSHGTRPDLSLIVCDGPAVVGATFTQNKMLAAPVVYSKAVYRERQTIRGVLVNSGQANAATGQTGWTDAMITAAAAASELGINPNNLMLASTGVIGKRIKMTELLAALPQVVASLARGERAASDVAVGITTTDLAYKSTALTVQLDGQEVRMGGCVKGSGMIHPNMATMLGVVTCDAAVDPFLWRQMVAEASANSFNQITVDGDTSTNDCVVAMASGFAGNDTIRDADSVDARVLQAALTALLQGLAKTIAWDGEGATVCIECEVTGAATQQDAQAIAKCVVGSSLVKAAVHGHDPNWGRIAAAVGRAQVEGAWDVNALCIHLGSTMLMQDGQPLMYDAGAASHYMRGEAAVRGTVRIGIRVGDGHGCGTAWGCDLSHAYVDINTAYN